MGMMAQPLPPVPQAGAGQPGPEAQAPPLAQAPEESQQGNPAKDQAQTIMRQIMDQRRANESMASQYPPAAKDLRAANEALKQAMLKIVREVQQIPGNQASPPVGPG
jgi:hypothetical protein